MPKRSLTQSSRLARAALAAALASLPALTAADRAPAVQLADRVATMRAAQALDDALSGDTLPDPHYAAQWNLRGELIGGANFAPSDDADTSNIVVGVVDSGFLLDHEDLQFLPGYDFVSSASVGNDGDGRDADPTDPGDWVDIGSADCTVGPSSWHGTRIAGIIGAKTSNGLGIAAANDRVDLLPVRVTGTCGGFIADLIDGIRWAAGLDVANAPPNPYPASVINVSLGFPGRCPQALQRAIDEASAAGAVIVTASTNSGVDLDVTPHAPAVCDQVLTAGAVTSGGRRASYSAYGAAVDVLAPGGNRTNGIITTDNTGSTIATAQSTYARHYGTSLAGAHLAATVAAIRSVADQLNTAQIGAIVRATATPRGPADGCELLACGGGILNASAALALAKIGPPDDLPVAPQLPESAAAQGSGAGAALLLPLALLASARRGTALSRRKSTSLLQITRIKQILQR